MADSGVTSSEAEAAWRAALARDPFDAAALHGLGCAVLEGKRPAEAVALLAASVRLGTTAGRLSDLGSALIASGQADEAERRLREAVALEPDLFQAVFNLGGLLLSRDTGEALGVLRRALALAPGDAEALKALGSALIAQGNAEYGAGDMVRAEAMYREALAFDADFAGGYNNLGNALAGQLRIEEALAAYRSAVALAPENDSFGFAYSLCLLLSGDEQEGWRQFEHRRGVPELRTNYARRPEIPWWEPGVSLEGRTVLLSAEQGSGDIIQFARFAPALARSAARVVLEIPWPMTGIFDALPGVDRVITMSDAAADCEIACPLMSLPLILGADAGIAPPYIDAPPHRVARWAAWLERSPPGRLVGLVCSGDPRHPHDARRSVPLKDFGPVLGVPDVAFVLVQTEIRDADRAAFDEVENVRCPAAALTDYADTAALLAGLDMVVSVDTSVAHLAGAMGLPVWTLLPYCPDYRWGLGRDETSWYPSMRLYRQDRPNDWETVIARIRDDLVRL